jgi:hypothetical protein
MISDVDDQKSIRLANAERHDIGIAPSDGAKDGVQTGHVAARYECRGY